MKIWEITASEKCMVVTIRANEANRLAGSTEFKGVPLREHWTPIGLEVIRKGLHKDFPYILPGVLIFTKKTEEILRPLVQNYVEFLSADQEDLLLVNVIEVVDCLDYNRSIFKRFSSSGRISNVEKVSFCKEKLGSAPIFKIPEKTSRIFVSDEFRDLVLNSKLKGLDFIEVWDSEMTDEEENRREQQYETMLAEIERNKGQEYSWSEAVAMVEAGKAMVSGKWKIQAETNGNFLTGQLNYEGNYDWVDPIFIPPVLLDLKWHEAEKSNI